MADAGWKSVERTVASLLGGVRSWGSDEDVDVKVPNAQNPEVFVEVKNLRTVSIADCERILAHNRAKAPPPLKSALVVKRKAGPGKKTPYLLVLDIEDFFAPEALIEKDMTA